MLIIPRIAQKAIKAYFHWGPKHAKSGQKQETQREGKQTKQQNSQDLELLCSVDLAFMAR